CCWFCSGWSVTSLCIVARPIEKYASRACRRGLRLRHVGSLPFHTAFVLPALDGLAELEEGADARRNREPEGDHPVGQYRGEHLLAREAAEDERAHHPRIAY